MKLKNLKRKRVSNGSIYYSQSNHNWRNTKFDIDTHGFLEKSLQGFTDYIWAHNLSCSGKNILLSREIEKCLQKLSGKTQEFCMWQNMIFDKSIGTIDHIDTWYLDTDPMGYLIAAWVALEDIDGNGGEFHVYPGSHLDDRTKPENWKNLNHEKFVEWSEEVSKSFKKTPIHLKAGDVLFWHPFLLHGSSNQKLKGFSRKSLTAHYHPVSMKRGGRGVVTNSSDSLYKTAVSDTTKNIRRFGSLPIYAHRNRINAMRSLVGATRYFLNFKNRDHMLMSRNDYTD